MAALGGRPSALSTEHLLRALALAQVNPEEQFLLVSLVDYDPSGRLIMRAFRHQLRALGVPRTG